MLEKFIPDIYQKSIYYINYDKLYKICSKYANYCNFYFLFDFNNLLSLKDAPIDKGKEIFEELMKNKIQVRLNNDL